MLTLFTLLLTTHGGRATKGLPTGLLEGLIGGPDGAADALMSDWRKNGGEQDPLGALHKTACDNKFPGALDLIFEDWMACKTLARMIAMENERWAREGGPDVLSMADSDDEPWTDEEVELAENLALLEENRTPLRLHGVQDVQAMDQNLAAHAWLGEFGGQGGFRHNGGLGLLDVTRPLEDDDEPEVSGFDYSDASPLQPPPTYHNPIVIRARPPTRPDSFNSGVSSFLDYRPSTDSSYHGSARTTSRLAERLVGRYGALRGAGDAGDGNEQSCSTYCEGGNGSVGVIVGTAPSCAASCEDDCPGRLCVQSGKGNFVDHGSGCWSGHKVCCCSK